AFHVTGVQTCALPIWPMMSGFHAFYSVGSLAGALLATLLLGSGRTPLATTLAVVAIVAALCAVSAGVWRRDRAPADATVFALPRDRKSVAQGTGRGGG